MAQREALAVDLGGTRLRVARVAVDGTVTAVERCDTPADGRPGPVIEAIVRLVDTMRASADSDALTGLGVAAPGPLDPTDGVVYDTPNLAGWHDVPLAARLAAQTGLPTWVHNDANLAALGEARHGAGRGYDPLIYLTVSTGVGGGIVQDGRIYAGRHGLAGELGHVIVHAGGPRCNFGHAGCLEALASGTAIARAARGVLRAGRASSIPDHAAEDGVTARAVAAAAEAGDALAVELYREAGDALGYAVAGFINAFDPARIVIGGGVSASWALFADAMQARVTEVAMSWDRRPIDIVPAALGDDAGLVGAAAHVFDCSAAQA